MLKELNCSFGRKDEDQRSEKAIAMIKPIGVEINLGDLCVDLLTLRGLSIVKRNHVSRISEEMAIEIYKRDFGYLRNLSPFHARSVIDSTDCGPLEILQIEGFNARKVLREVVGYVDRPDNSLRWYTSKTVASDKRLRHDVMKITSLDLYEAIVVANGVHATKNQEEFDIAMLVVNQLKIEHK